MVQLILQIFCTYNVYLPLTPMKWANTSWELLFWCGVLDDAFWQMSQWTSNNLYRGWDLFLFWHSYDVSMLPNFRTVQCQFEGCHLIIRNQTKVDIHRKQKITFIWVSLLEAWGASALGYLDCDFVWLIIEYALAYLPLDRMTAISQKTLSNAFSWTRMLWFGL